MSTHTIVLAVFLIPILITQSVFAEEDFFDLSLEELVSLRIDGYAVRDLQLFSPVHTGYSGEHENFTIGATIDVIDEKTIAARGLANVVEVAENMVGVLSGESPSEPYSLSMRGFSRDTVKVLYDGVSIGNATSNMRPLATHNLKQVEIIKGPSVLRHGQGASAGAINFIYKQPDQNGEPSSTSSFSRGSYGAMSAGASMNMPLSNGAYRIDLFHRENDGWIDDADFSSTDLHLSYLLASISNIKLYFRYSHQADDLSAYWGTPLVPLEVAKNPSGAVTRNDGLVLDKSLLGKNYNVNDHIIASSSDWYRIDMEWELGRNLRNKTIAYAYSANREWRNSESYIFDVNTNLVDRDRLLVTHDRNVTGLQSNFNIKHFSFGKRNFLSLALEYSVTDFFRTVGFDENSFFVDTVSLLAPVSGYFGGVSERDETIDESILALVAGNIIELSDATNIELAVRQEQIDIKREQFNFDGTDRGGLNDTYDLTSYRFAMTHELHKGSRLFFNLSEQHDGITGDLVEALVEDFSDFEPSDTSQVEIGIKSSFFDSSLQLYASLFSIEKRSKLMRDGSASTAKTLSDGLEFSFSNQFTDSFKLGFNAAYVDARYGNYYDLSFDRDVTGNRPVNIPELMASSWGSFSNVFGFPLEVGVGANYVSERFADSSNQTTLEAYTLYHFFLGYHVDNLRVMFQVRNATDETYVPWSDIYYSEQVLVAPPRLCEVNMKVLF